MRSTIQSRAAINSREFDRFDQLDRFHLLIEAIAPDGSTFSCKYYALCSSFP
jgi:hypothetical protein